MLTEVAPGVFSVDHRVAAGKNGIVIGERAALAIDTGHYPDEGQAMADFIRAQGRAPDRLTFTHGHGDHILGSGGFLGAEVIAHVLTPSVMRGKLPMLAGRVGVSPEQLEAQIAWPTITFTGELRVDLGGKHVRLFPTPGHSEDSVSVYVEENHVLFGGDTVFSEIIPAIGDGDGAELESTLRALAEMDIEILVPGHGKIRHGTESVREWLGWLADYLARVRAFVRDELGRGQAPEVVADAVSYQRVVEGRLSPDKHGMVKRHRSTVEKIVREELGTFGI
jgi:cyclase